MVFKSLGTAQLRNSWCPDSVHKVVSDNSTLDYLDIYSLSSAAAKYVGCWTLHRQQLYIPTVVDTVFTVLFLLEVDSRVDGIVGT